MILPSCDKTLTLLLLLLDRGRHLLLLFLLSLTAAITQLLSITCSKMNEDGLCVTTQPVYIYFNRYSGEEEEEGGGQIEAESLS